MLQKIKNLFKRKKKSQNLPIEDNVSKTKNLQEWAEYLFVKSYVCPTGFYLNNLSIGEFYNKLSNCNIEFLSPAIYYSINILKILNVLDVQSVI
jgi:hypothetical protein